MRAKVRLNSITDNGWQKVLKLAPVTGGSTENDSFWKATPNGSIELGVDNLPAVEGMKVGDEFYVDFTKAG
jgi:hypothetical protein